MSIYAKDAFAATSSADSMNWTILVASWSTDAADESFDAAPQDRAHAHAVEGGALQRVGRAGR